MKKTHEDDILRIIENLNPSLAEPDVHVKRDPEKEEWIKKELNDFRLTLLDPDEIKQESKDVPDIPFEGQIF